MHRITKAGPEDHKEIMRIWESSVRATHFFIKEEDLCFYKELIGTRYLSSLDIYLIGSEEGYQGFAGISGTDLEMLFVEGEAIGKGLGRTLLQYAIQNKGIRKLDVNEQNENAIAFYSAFGFRKNRWSETDGTGKAYPIIHMVLEGFDS